MRQEVFAPPLCEVIILTALAVECEAVIGHLEDPQEIVHEQGTIYHCGNFVGEQYTWHVAVAEIGMHGPAAAVETERAIAFLRPGFAFFVGVAGGLKDVRIGDVVVATKVYGYEAGKAGQHFEPRPELWRVAHTLEQRARAEAHYRHWLSRLGTSRPDSAPRVLIGPIAAGENVVASQHSSVLHLLRSAYSDALAVEMESHGFLQAVHTNRSVDGLIVRGISDLIEHKAEADASGSQIVAARHAAAFAFQVLAKLKPSLEHGPSPPKEIANYQMESQQSPLPASPEQIWTVPFARNPFFTGREQELELLHVQLHQRHEAAVGQAQSISGLGGIGKTQLVVEYAYRHGHKYDYVLWAHAESVERLNASYTIFAELLNLPEQGAKEQEVLVQAVKKWFQTHHKWLLILDNADEPNVLVPFLPSSSNGHLLVTTRTADLTSLSVGIAHPLEMAPWPAEQSAQFLLQRANLLDRQRSLEEVSLQDRALALQIAHELGNLPLALDQAGAYLIATGTSMAEYLSLYQQRRPDLLREYRNLAYPHSVATTWNLSFARVEARNPAAAELLRVCAFLALDIIPEEILTMGASFLGPVLSPVASDAFRLSIAIRELHAYSLVRRNHREKTLTIHRLVRAVLQDGMEEAEQRLWARRAMLAVNAAFPVAEHRNWPQCERLLPQALAATELIERYQLSSAEAGRLLSETASYLQDRPHSTQVELLYRRALDSKGQQEHTEVAYLRDNLVSLYQEQGKYEQADPLYQRALHILEQQLGREYPDITSQLGGLAKVCEEQGKYAQAESLYQQALRILGQQLGLEHPDLVYSLSGLANLYYKQGKYTQAEPLCRRALHIWEQQLGPEHPLVASPLNSLALLYQAQGEDTKAELLYQRALRILEHKLGEEHIFTKIIQKNYNVGS